MRFYGSFFCSLLMLSLAGAGHGVDLETQPEFLAAQRALRDGLPAVAALKAARLMQAMPPQSPERQTLVGLAVESWIRARDGVAALGLLDHEQVPNAVFWRAQALVLTGEVESAEKLLLLRVKKGEATSQERLLLGQTSLMTENTTQAREILEPLREVADARIAEQATLMCAEAELRTGNTQKAVSALEKLPLDKNLHAKLLYGQGLVELDQHGKAQRILREILGGGGGGEQVHHSAAVLLADCLRREQKPAEAAEVLVQFLDNTISSELWGAAFDLLARCLNEAGPNVSPPDAVMRWLSEGNTVQREVIPAPSSAGVFQGYTMLLLSRWLVTQSRLDEALGLLEAMIQVHAGHPQTDEAMKLALETYGTMKATTRINALADIWRRRFGNSGSAMVEFVTASTAYNQGQHQQSAELFLTAANLAGTLAERRSALYNAGVAALRAGELTLYQTVLGQLQVVSADAPSSSQDGSVDLELDRLLDLAAKAKTGVEEELRLFTQLHPQHARLAEAYIAQAEVLLLRVPTDFPAVDRALQAAAKITSLSDEQRQQIIITRLWQHDRQGKLKEVVEQGGEFIKQWPGSSSVTLVRMKVADAYYRLENFAAARTEYELVFKENAASPYADTAQYFAGMAALSMMSDEGREAALTLWQELAERGGPLSIPARQQQALAKRRAGQEQESLKLLDALLTEKSLPEEQHRSLACEKAEILMLLGKTDATRLSAAIKVLNDLIAEDDLSYKWHARAGYTLAVALNSAGQSMEALEACHDVVESTGFSGPADPSEFRWYYRAGFLGIDLLEASKQWEAAARLAEKLSLSSGDRAAEAKERATKIRLEHFLWDGK